MRKAHIRFNCNKQNHINSVQNKFIKNTFNTWALYKIFSTVNVKSQKGQKHYDCKCNDAATPQAMQYPLNKRTVANFGD